MPKSVDTLVLLLPESRRFAGQILDADFARRLGRADTLPVAEYGERAQLLRYFELFPRGWPIAAITRQADCGDAIQNSWLRADPAHVRAEMGSVRLLGCGELGLTPAEAQEFLRPLKPLFGDAGFPISAPLPSRWYLMLPRDAKLPVFVPPTDALGGDVFAHMPDGSEGRRWRALLNEAQILLHNHPRNAERIASGMPAINSVWFWGGGVLPDSVRCSAKSVIGDDIELRGLCQLAGVGDSDEATGDRIVDCRHERNLATLASSQLASAFSALGNRYSRLIFDFADGKRVLFAPKQRWRFWRRSANKFA